MANPTTSDGKQPGRMRQVIDIVKMTAKYDKPGIAIMIVAFVLPVIIALVLCLTLFSTNVIMWIMLMILGLLVGLLLFMFALNWRAEKVAYSQLEGQKGATGAVLQSSLRGTWKTSEMPVAFNARTQDVIFRAVGKPGVVLFSESNSAAAKKLLQDERRQVQRVLPNVPVHQIQVGPGGVALSDLKGAIRKLPKKLTREEILALDSRLESLKKNELPIPKGVDPARMRPSRSQMR